MKLIKALLIASLLTLTVHAGWKPLKSLEHYRHTYRVYVKK